jgi:voltage-gated potassium channel
MAALMLRPTVISFLDMITHVGDVVLDLEDIVLGEKSVLIGHTLKSARIPEKTGLIVLAIQKSGAARMHFNPGSDEKLEIGDSMIVLGTSEQVASLRKLACDVGDRECP